MSNVAVASSASSASSSGTSSATSLTGRTPGRSAQPLANPTTSSTTSSAIPSRNSKRQESGPALAPAELTLSQTSTGVGVAPSIEVRSGDVEGFDARDSADVDWLVMLYRPPPQDRTVGG